MNENLVVGYSYTRFSTGSQKDGHSQDRQDLLVESYARRKNITLDTTLTFRDQGISAYAGAHALKGALGKFLAAIQSGRVKRGSVLLVEALDRLSREHPLEAMRTIETIIRAGVSIYTVEDEVVYSYESIDGDFKGLANGLDLARRYSMRLSLRVGAAWKKKKEEITKPISKMCPAWLLVQGNEYQVIEERAVIVKRIFEECAGGLGAEKTAKRLNEEKVPPFSRTGQGMTAQDKFTLWHGSYIKKILENRSVLGFYQPHIKLTVDGKKRREVSGEEKKIYPQIIDYELWEKTRAAKASRASTGGRTGHKFANILKGLCVCAECGSSMNLRIKGARRATSKEEHNYLLCNKAMRGGECTNKTHYRYEGYERTILAAITTFNLFDTDVFVKADNTALYEAISEIEAEIKTKQTHFNNMMASFAGGTSTRVAAAMDALDVDIIKLESKLAKLKREKEISRGKDYLNHAEVIKSKVNTAQYSLIEDERYLARAQINQALQGMVENIRFGDDVKLYMAGNQLSFGMDRQFKIQNVMMYDEEKIMYFTRDNYEVRDTPDFLKGAVSRRGEEIAMRLLHKLNI